MKKLLLITSTIVALAFTNFAQAEESPTGWDEALTIKSVDTPPVPVEQSSPNVPNSLKGKTAVVHVGFVVDSKGAVTAVHVVKTTDTTFDEISKKCVSNWKFKPAVNVGEPIPVRVIVPLRYKG